MDVSAPEAEQRVIDAVLAWRRTHPKATFAELEGVVETQLDRLRATVLAAAAPAVPAERPVCPTCAGAMQARGERERRLTTAGDQQVHLQRPYYWCPTCAVGLFPP